MVIIQVTVKLKDNFFETILEKVKKHYEGVNFNSPLSLVELEPVLDKIINESFDDLIEIEYP